MTLPTLLFALVVAMLYGALYHFLRGGKFWRLVMYIVLSIIGFALGQVVGAWRGWILYPLGSLDLGNSSIGSLITLVIGDWLSRVEPNEESKV